MGLHHWLEEMNHLPSTAGTSRIHPGCSEAEHQLEAKESPPASNEALTQQLPWFRPGCRRFVSSFCLFDLALFTHREKRANNRLHAKRITCPHIIRIVDSAKTCTYKHNKIKMSPWQGVDVDRRTMAHANHPCHSHTHNQRKNEQNNCN